VTGQARQPRLAHPDSMTRVGQKSLRAHNLCLVFSNVAAAGTENPRSRAGLADATGLTKATISALVARLIDLDLIKELPAPTAHRVGRPGIPLVVAEGTVAALGLEINVDFMGIRAIDLTGAVLAESFRRMNLRGESPAVAFEALARIAYDLISGLTSRSVRIIGAALALPGIADRPSGPLRLAPNLGWSDLNVQQQMADTLQGLAVTLGGTREGRRTLSIMDTLLVDGLTVENEANLAARTEIGDSSNQSFIYVSGEIGIGAAIVVDGQVFSGMHGWAGEIGHITVDASGPVCACGSNGCLEMYAGKRHLMTGAGLSPDDAVEDLAAAYAAGDELARTAVDRASAALGIALANCMNLVDVSRVVLGGSFAPLAGALSRGLTSQISARLLSAHWVSEDIDLQPSTAGEYAATTGAALAVLDEAVTNPASGLWDK